MTIRKIDSETVEFHRFGSEPGILAIGNRYICAAGFEEKLSEIQLEIGHRDFLINFNLLRYRTNADEAKVTSAKNFLADQAERFLQIPSERGEDSLYQLDIVTHAAELWAFPFEACLAKNPHWLKEPDRGLVLTRRIRGAFSEKVPPWPEKPSILFVHAPVTDDLEKELVDRHIKALNAALAPWAAGGDAIKMNLLTVQCVRSADEISSARASLNPAACYIHILAHGALVKVDPDLPEERLWGLRLGYEGAAGISPIDIADALKPIDGLPLVVTIAACDSGNQQDPAMGNGSVVQEIHRQGIPVVIGSQLPLTKDGSVEFSRSFYGPLLEGQDVRTAMHIGRVALSQGDGFGHDWLSLVGYVRLPPEGYAEHLTEFAIRAELGMLKSIQSGADELTINGGSELQFCEMENLLQKRIASLQIKRNELGPDNARLSLECGGLLASAYKRIGELFSIRAEHYSCMREQDLAASRVALESSLNAYRNVFRSHPESHWHGIQQISLEAVLNGCLSRPRELDLIRWTTELAIDNDPKDYWSCGTLVEALLLAPIGGQQVDMEAIHDAVQALRNRAGTDSFPIESTRRQINRYNTWWTKGNGYFPGMADLSHVSTEIVALLA